MSRLSEGGYKDRYYDSRQKNIELLKEQRRLEQELKHAKAKNIRLGHLSRGTGGSSDGAVDGLVSSLREQNQTLLAQLKELKAHQRMLSMGARLKGSARGGSRRRPRRTRQPQKPPVEFESKTDDTSAVEHREQLLQLQSTLAHRLSLQSAQNATSASATTTSALERSPPPTHLQRTRRAEYMQTVDPEDLASIRAELRQKRGAIALLQSKFDDLSLKFRTEKQLQQHAVVQCEEWKKKVLRLQAENRALKSDLETARMSNEHVKSLRIMLDDKSNECASLAERVAMLTSTMFGQNEDEEARVSELRSQHRVELERVKTSAEDTQKTVKALRETLASEQARNTAFEEKLAAEFAQGKQRELLLHETVRKLKAAEQRLAVFSEDSAVGVEDLERALDIVRREKEDPSRVALVSTSSEEQQAQDVLNEGKSADSGVITRAAHLRVKKRVDEMEIRCKDLLEEVNTKEAMLALQYKINRQQADKAAKDQKLIEELTREVQQLRYELSRRTGHVFDTPIPGRGSVLGTPVPSRRPQTSLRDMAEEDSIFSADTGPPEESSLRNEVAIRVVGANFFEDCPVFEQVKNGQASILSDQKKKGDLITFLGVDFLSFETRWSNVFGGYDPDYSFTTVYKVTSDQFFVTYLSENFVSIDVFMQVAGTDVVKLGTCRIPLRQLLHPYAVVHGKEKIIATHLLSKGDPNVWSRNPPAEAVVGTLEFFFQLKHPIVDPVGAPVRLGQQENQQTIAHNADQLFEKVLDRTALVQNPHRSVLSDSAQGGYEGFEVTLGLDVASCKIKSSCLQAAGEIGAAIVRSSSSVGDMVECKYSIVMSGYSPYFGLDGEVFTTDTTSAMVRGTDPSSASDSVVEQSARLRNELKTGTHSTDRTAVSMLRMIGAETSSKQIASRMFALQFRVQDKPLNGASTIVVRVGLTNINSIGVIWLGYLDVPVSQMTASRERTGRLPTLQYVLYSMTRANQDADPTTGPTSPTVIGEISAAVLWSLVPKSDYMYTGESKPSTKNGLTQFVPYSRVGNTLSDESFLSRPSTEPATVQDPAVTETKESVVAPTATEAPQQPAPQPAVRPAEKPAQSPADKQLADLDTWDDARFDDFVKEVVGGSIQ